ncbi:uncharacterized protein LTR77_009703 [Saxophila tyrrhenica]|uniref:Uncharacterized protein n=1 Tax=Saxophila tyrrhenica TaxID=1690608 RepID=A0AAV9P0F8_9PEZI|nr:hypothetical protein LTR77_009703 [Saxophila tyrrhenica]
MSSAEAQLVYQRGSDFAEPIEAAETFSRQFDLSQPDKAMDAYQKIMHQHTKQQFEMANASERRRSKNGSMGGVSLSSETSNGSVSSTSS